MSKILCDLCSKHLTESDSWIGLNRWTINCNGRFKMQSQSRGYVWSPQKATWTGRSLCFPYCAIKWLEGEMIEVALPPKG